MNKSKWTDLRTRTFSSAVLLVLAILCVSLGGVAFAAIMIFAAIIMNKEWEGLVTEQPSAYRAWGYPYIIIPCACILWLRSISIVSDPMLGFKLVIALIAVISATDIGAYFAGRKFGFHKLYPAISPNKTWEGLAGGVIAATIVGTSFAHYMNVPDSSIIAFLVSPVIAVIAQVGDLFKSWIKRKAGVKDAGTLIPGHGGLLDRLDGYMFSAPVLALIVYIALKAYF